MHTAVRHGIAFLPVICFIMAGWLAVLPAACVVCMVAIVNRFKWMIAVDNTNIILGKSKEKCKSGEV